MKNTGRSLIGAVVGVLLLATGCGLPSDRSPRVIDPETVPYDLAGPAQLDAPAIDGENGSPITVYLVDEIAGESRLVRSERQISGPVNLDTVIANLMAGGVTQSERQAGMSNLVPGDELRTVTRSDSGSNSSTPLHVGPEPWAMVDVNAEFFARFPTQQRQLLAIGQIVLTITSYRSSSDAPAIERVSFSVDGQAKTVPVFRRDKAGAVAEVVSAADYAGLVVEVATSINTGSTSSTSSP